MSAETNKSNGAPSIIWLVSFPEELIMTCVCNPVSASKALQISSIAYCILAAVAIVMIGVLREAHPAKRIMSRKLKNTLMLVYIRCGLFIERLLTAVTAEIYVFSLIINYMFCCALLDWDLADRVDVKVMR